MGKAMLASGMTDGQIDDLANKLRDAARIHRDEIEKDPAQQGLRSENIGMRLFAEFRRIVEEVSGYIVRIVTVNRERSPHDALKASGRKLYVTESVVATMPRGVGDKAKLVYFKPGLECYKNSWMSCATLAEEYKKRGLVPDPQAQVDDNEANPEFADTMPNACQWVDKDGNYCYAAFRRWDGGRFVYVDRHDDVWSGSWSFAGVPEESSASVV